MSYWFDDFYREYCLEGTKGGGGSSDGGGDFWDDGDDDFFDGVSLEDEKNCTDGECSVFESFEDNAAREWQLALIGQMAESRNLVLIRYRYRLTNSIVKKVFVNVNSQ